MSFLSKGGYTIDKYLLDTERQALWARQVPDLSVLHIGACDLANTDKYTLENVKELFIADLGRFLEEWPKLAKKRLTEQRQKRRLIICMKSIFLPVDSSAVLLGGSYHQV